MLLTCRQCLRHIKHTETECPFCHTASEGRSLSQRTTAAVVLGAALALSGCTREAQHVKYGAPPPPSGGALETSQPTSTSQPRQPDVAPAYGAPVFDSPPTPK